MSTEFTRQIMSLQKEVDNLTSSISSMKGEKAAIMRQIEKEFGIKDEKHIDAKIKELNAELKEKKETITAVIEEVRGILDEFDSQF